MGVVSKLKCLVSDSIFKEMIELNKIQIRSFLLVVVLLGLKSVLGIWVILTIFIGDEKMILQTMYEIRQYFGQSLIESSKMDILSTSIMMIMNVLGIVLYLNPFKRLSSLKSSRILLFLMLIFQSGQYLGIIIVCANILSGVSLGDYFLVIFNGVNLVLFIVCILIFKGFNFTISHGMNNILGRFPSSHNSMVQFILMLMTVVLVFMSYGGLSEISKVIMCIGYLVMRILTISKIIHKIDYSLTKWHYIDPTVQCFYSFTVLVQTIALLFNLVLQITTQPLIGQNFYLCVFITATFCFFGWKNYFLNQQQNLNFYTGKDIKLITQAALYFKALYDLSGKGQTNHYTTLLLSSIRKQHEIHCHNKLCYCKSVKQDIQFAQDYIIQQLDSLRLHFKNQPKILIQELNFRFKMYNTYPDVLTNLQKIKNHFTLGIIQNFSIATLKTDLIQWMDQRNRRANTIDIQTPLKLQQTIQQIENIIDKDIEKKNNKWRYLSQGLCRTDQLEEDINSQISFIKEINHIQHQWNKKMKRSTVFNYLLLFYYKKVSFLNVNVDQIYKNINEAMKKVKEEELSSVKQFAKCLFHKRSCVIESPINEDNMGIVTRASKNVFDLFGYQPSKIIGINMNRLMPNFMAIEHDIILAEWVKNGTWRTVGKLKEIFGIHKDQYCFNALLYLKIIANQKGLFFITVVFKKNESDYLVLNSKKQIQGIGRKFLQVIGNNCRRLPIQVLFDNFPDQEIPKNFEYKTFVRTFRSFRNNDQLVEEFFQNKNLLVQRENSMNDLVKQYQQRLNHCVNLQRWEVKFQAKLYKMRQVRYYIILLNHARLITSEEKSSLSTIQHGKLQNILVGHGKMNQDEDSSFDNSKKSSESTAGQNKAQFIDDKGSSVASFVERENFTLTKLLSIFFNYLINPQEISDRRVNTLNISTFLETLALTAIISFSFTVYSGSMEDIGQYISADAVINENMQRVMVMYNRVISFQEYRNDKATLSQILGGTLSDMNDFYGTSTWQMLHIKQAESAYSKQKMYDYLYTNVDWQYRENHSSFFLQTFLFLEFYYYVTGSIAMNVYANATINLVEDRHYEISRIKSNFPHLKTKIQSFTDHFSLLTQNSISNLTTISVIMTAFFFIITSIFFIYTCNYHRFRNQQKYQCLHIYKNIPSQLLTSLKNYYIQLYIDFKQINNKNTGIQLDFQAFTQHQLALQENTFTMGNTHIKFLGRKSFYGWIRPLLIFLSVNVINIIITYKIVAFVNPLDKLIDDSNNIMKSQNQLYQSYLQLKGAYILSETPQITDSLINQLMNIVAQNQVTFNQMVTFSSQTLTKYDSKFSDDFKNILVNNICDQIKDQINAQQYANCMSLAKTTMISDGIITFMNHLQRSLRSTALDLQANWQSRFKQEGDKYFVNRGFKDIDLVMTFNIKIFRKLIQRILLAYQKGVNYITLLNYIIVGMLITPQIIALIFWFRLAISEKIKISFLYGSILTIPPQLIRQVKNLPRLTKKMLQFSQT